MRWPGTQVRRLDARRYTMTSAPDLLAKGRPWRDYCDSDRPLKGAIRGLVRKE
jgi:bifunctional non-homologous end joining protein LigD